MLTYLLDVNVLIALIDPTHVNHRPVFAWFQAEGSASWASCPITENGVLRIVSHPNYPNTPGAPAIVAGVLARLLDFPGHVFWPDEISLMDRDRADRGRLLTHGQVTDSYLLALAVARGGRLATLDRRLSAAAVPGGASALRVI